MTLRNQTLSWANIQIVLPNLEGGETSHPYEISPEILFEHSEAGSQQNHRFFFGAEIKKLRAKKGFSQRELADKSGTSKTYISRLENNQIEPELSTLYKIVEIGLGRKIKVEIV